MRSTELDDFDESLFLWFESLGNKKNNDRWEAELPATMRRPLDNPYESPECIRRWWLKAKYDEMRFLAGSAPLAEQTGGEKHEAMRGWLSKQGSMLPTWKRRFFVVEGSRLLYYHDEDCDVSKLRDAFALAHCLVALDPDDRRHPHTSPPPAHTQPLHAHTSATRIHLAALTVLAASGSSSRCVRGSARRAAR